VLDPELSAKEVADAMALRRQLEETRAERSEFAGRLAGYEQRVSTLLAHIETQKRFLDVLLAQRPGVAA
jgi:hypothetical protein